MESIYIKKIEVSKLFGVYDYNIDLSHNKGYGLSILYGDNGAGKSTILRLIYFLLSSKLQAGHKSNVGNIEFRSFKIEMSNGSEIIADRSKAKDSLSGGFTYSLVKNKKKQSVTFETCSREGQPAVTLKDESSSFKVYKSIIYELSSYKILFISDNRRDIDKEENDDDILGVITRPNVKYPRLVDDKTDVLVGEIRKLENWIVSSVLNASMKGEEKNSEVYDHILASLTSKKEQSVISVEDIKKELNDISEKTKRFVTLGFISDPEYNTVINRLDKIDAIDIQITYKILYPYIETQKKKLESLDRLVNTISFLVQNLQNNYLYNKEVSYSVVDGFKITHKGKDGNIDYSSFSSGEKQLILLFSKIIRQAGQSSLIIIDEPEISLNIKWQRNLMDTILYLIKDTNTQLLISTHSFEILSKHVKDVVKLENTDGRNL